MSNDGGALGNRVCALIKGTPESCLTCPQERTELKVSHLEENLTRAGPHWLLISNFQPPELGEINSHCWQATQSMTVWYTSLDWERQLSIWPRGEGHLTSSLLKIGKDGWWSWAQADVMGREGGPGRVLTREYLHSALFSLQIRTRDGRKGHLSKQHGTDPSAQAGLPPHPKLLH